MRQKGGKTSNLSLDLKRLVRVTGMSRADLAKEVGVNVRTLSRWMDEYDNLAPQSKHLAKLKTVLRAHGIVTQLTDFQVSVIDLNYLVGVVNTAGGTVRMSTILDILSGLSESKKEGKS